MGYIGSHTILRLLETTEYRVVCFDNLSRSRAQVGEWVGRIAGRHAEFLEVDLRDRAAVDQAVMSLGPIAGVIHFAAFKSVDESVREPHLYYQNNVAGLINLMEACGQHGVTNFLFSSSCTVYGNTPQLPVRESTPLAPASPYGETKRIGELLLDSASKNSDLRAISLRYFNPVGAHPGGKLGELPIGKPNNLVPILAQVASGRSPQIIIYGEDYDTRDGSCVRDYVHVLDIAEAHLLAFERMKANHMKGDFEVFNLGTGQGVSVKEAVAAFEAVISRELPKSIGPRRSGDVAAIYSDTKLAERELGWRPKYDLHTMMKSAWAWQKFVEAEGLMDK